MRPEYVGGELVKVAFANNQAEAELIQGILLEEGIPSLERRMRGFEIPDFMAGGPRDVLVPAAAAEVAKELLGGFESVEDHARDAAAAEAGRSQIERLPYGAQLALGLMIAVLLGTLIIYGLYKLTS